MFAHLLWPAMVRVAVVAKGEIIRAGSESLEAGRWRLEARG
jgi:hypothetical protein